MNQPCPLLSRTIYTKENSSQCRTFRTVYFSVGEKPQNPDKNFRSTGETQQAIILTYNTYRTWRESKAFALVIGEHNSPRRQLCFGVFFEILRGLKFQSSNYRTCLVIRGLWYARLTTAFFWKSRAVEFRRPDKTKFIQQGFTTLL